MQRVPFYYLILVIIFLGTLGSFDCFRENHLDNKTKISEILVKTVKGIVERNKTVLDSVCTEGVSQKILDDIYKEEGIGQVRLVEGYADESNKWDIKLLIQGESKNDTRPTFLVNLYPEKESGEWRVKSFDVKMKIWKTDGKMINIDNFDRY